MNYLTLIQELEQLTQQLGLRIRYEKGDFEGGYCIVRDEKVLVVNKRLHDMRKASVLALALREFGVETVFLKPMVREFIEDEWAKSVRQK